jgi:hypothetical protein
MIFLVHELNEKSKERPFGYKNLVLKLSKKLDHGCFELSQENYNFIKQKYGDRTNIIWKIKNFFKSIFQILNSIFTGKVFSTYLLKQKRMSVCKKCENFQKKTKTCKICTCFMPFKTKFLAMKCPINKW